MDILKELDEVKTSFRGLDKKAVEDLIGVILKECEEEKDKSMADLVRQNQTLQTELKECKDHLQNLKEQNRMLLKNLESMSESIKDGTDYARERDRELDGYKKKEKELDTLLEKTRQEAYEERKRILDEVEARRNSLLMEVEEEKASLLAGAKKEAEEIFQKAKLEADHIREEAEESYQELLERSVRVRKYLDEMKNRMLMLLSWEEEHLDGELTETGMQMKETEAPAMEAEEHMETLEEAEQPENANEALRVESEGDI